jgi:hypothetical protein
MRAGKEKKLPPPATEFIVPASTAATKSKMPWEKVITGKFEKEQVKTQSAKRKRQSRNLRLDEFKSSEVA